MSDQMSDDDLKVLIVDDSKAMQTILRRGIEALGKREIVLRYASNGKEALDVVEEWHPQLVLCDWHMPEMSGIELLERINMKMIQLDFGFITTDYSDARQQEAVNAGAQFIITKPFDTETLHQAIAPLLSKKQTGPSAASLDDNHELTLPAATDIEKLLNFEAVMRVSVSTTAIQCSREKGLPYLIALFANPTTDALQAAAILDGAAAGVIPSILHGLPVIASKNVLKNKTVPDDMLADCEEKLERVAHQIIDKKSGSPLTLKKTMVVKTLNSAVDKILNKPGAHRLDITLRSSDYGTGRMTIISS